MYFKRVSFILCELYLNRQEYKYCMNAHLCFPAGLCGRWGAWVSDSSAPVQGGLRGSGQRVDAESTTGTEELGGHQSTLQRAVTPGMKGFMFTLVDRAVAATTGCDGRTALNRPVNEP